MPYRSDRNYLFADGDLSQGLRVQESRITEKVDSIPEREFSRQSDDELVLALVPDLSIHPLVLDESAQTMTQGETEVDVRHDRYRMIRDRDLPAMVPGVRVGIFVPFVGDPQLWKLRPNSFRSTVPSGAIHSERGMMGGVIEVIFEQPADLPPERIKQEYERELESIRFYVRSQLDQVQAHNDAVVGQIRKAILARRQRLERHSGLSDLLGIPAVDAASPAAAAAHRPGAPAPKTEPRRKEAPRGKGAWDVFISHASEDKDSIARPLAMELAKRGLHVWFDESTLTVGDSLRRSIDEGLRSSSFGVVIISEAFLKKDWPQKELDGMAALEVDARKVMLPVWHGVDAAKVRSYSPMLADRVATNSARGLNTVVDELLVAIRKKDST